MGTQDEKEERERRDGRAAGRENYPGRILGDIEDEDISSATTRRKRRRLKGRRSKVEVAFFSYFSLFGCPEDNNT